MLAALVAFLATQYRYALRAPFVADDFLFLKKTQSSDFLSLWSPSNLAFSYYRPWSREFHYWSLIHLFGFQQVPFHVVSFALAATSGLLFFLLARKIAGAAIAGVATAAVFSLAAWGAIMVWIAGSQDLWMLVFVLGALLALAQGRLGLAVALEALALLSKETAAVMPAIAVAYLLWIERRSVREAAPRTAPLWGLLVLWAIVHPQLGGRFYHPVHATAAIAGLHQPAGSIASRTLLTLVNLEPLPAPAKGWAAAILGGLAGAALLLVVALARDRSPSKARPSETSRPTRRQIVGFGATWALIAWTPLFVPTLGWHAYYAMLGIFGAWLALAALISTRWAVTIPAVVTLAVLRCAVAQTQSSDWGTEWYQRRATSFGSYTHYWFVTHYPQIPPYSRIYLSNVPGGVGLVPGGEESIAPQVWYADTTIETHFLSRYQPRRPSQHAGTDYFVVFDGATKHWRDLLVGPEDLTGRTARDVEWVGEKRDLFSLMVQVEDWRLAGLQAEKLAAVYPDSARFAYDAGYCRYRLGDPQGAKTWFDRAAALPGADAKMIETARKFGASRGGGGK